jgi:3-oxoacyl-[acyl-carrier-protein] synthase III
MNGISDCYLTATGGYLPGPPVPNDRIRAYLGTLEGESEVAQRVLAMNGIVERHYAQDESQRSTEDVYQLATRSAQACLAEAMPRNPVTFLAAGTTYSPLSAPGIASIVHHRLQAAALFSHPVEISSHAGICTSSAAALVAAVRSVRLGEHASALSIGAEHASEVLKSSAIRPIDDRAEHDDVRKSQWFMSVFLRFMLSDGAGAFLLERTPRPEGISLRVDWTHSSSFAHAGPLCMKLDNATRLLSQDVTVLSRYFYGFAREFVATALERHKEKLPSYRVVLPHMSSFFFQRRMEKILRELSPNAAQPVPYWTNLATAGNTGAASIYVMLDHYLRQHTLTSGDRLLLFIPESGQFNFVLVSLTAVSP